MKNYIIGGFIGALIIILIEVVLGFYFYQYQVKPQMDDYTKHRGDPPPFQKDISLSGDIELSTGEKITVGGGDILVVNRWATWCPPCVAELPSLGELHDKTSSNGVRVLCVTRENELDLDEWAKEKGFDVPLFNSVKLPFDMKSRSIPVTWIIDGDGVLKFSHKGKADWAHDDVISFLKDQKGWKE
jgi:thiol-disulfide isomerase/thioredoxin